ncbi:PREDICTED: diffuse panbronchiolitis critical region protein 1-like [Elephantulus edwardii]|uniref:diffuse panbronchiolitis critical region protein 1-like n=1 Tax=Elephantulus edwardii TaxID=28737 RepID=UPI0003F0B785|nr:PREDICTED: diffuse panbronchiolitis critical region protein 1-like [Elephantulus edwardii]
MAQPAHCFLSTFGLQGCLLFLLVSWEAGATMLQDLQKTGESSTADPLLHIAPGLVSNSPIRHSALDSAHSPPVLPKSTGIHKVKQYCNTTRHLKPVHTPKENSKTTDQKSSPTHEAPSTSKQNSSNEGKVIRNERSAESGNTNNHKSSSDVKHTTPRSTGKINSMTTETPEKITSVPVKTTDVPESTIEVTEKIASAPVRTTHVLELTTEIPERITKLATEIPEKTTHPYQNKDGSKEGLHAGVMGENDSFPAWAIVIVVLVAVILLLVFLGLIFLISYLTGKRRPLTQNTDDKDLEDEGGPNSYPVYLMEQQTLGTGQIPSSR